jgi:lysophospholipid acyltransferase (LPLAT)-like uncharacterized protein
MAKSPLKDKILLAVAPRAFWLFLRLLGLTIRKKFVYRADPIPYWKAGQYVLGAFWHQRLLMMLFMPFQGKVGMLISRHRDGEYIARVSKLFGIDSVRGSSTRGGLSAVRGMVRFYESGANLAITPDGPQGPKHVVQMGVIELARQTGAPIFPATYGASWKKVFNSWDNFILPLPFCRVVYIVGEPVFVPADADREVLEEKRLLLQERLRGLTRDADQFWQKDAKEP